MSTIHAMNRCAVRRYVVQEQHGVTSECLRLETERENLTYLLSHAELTEHELSEVSGRLAFVED
jgi:hypothetical protein